ETELHWRERFKRLIGEEWCQRVGFLNANKNSSEADEDHDEKTQEDAETIRDDATTTQEGIVDRRWLPVIHWRCHIWPLTQLSRKARNLTSQA
ncbi:hypothetical protein H0H87_003969, partial [Tephrocybe sp. NHM501043]